MLNNCIFINSLFCVPVDTIMFQEMVCHLPYCLIPGTQCHLQILSTSRNSSQHVPNLIQSQGLKQTRWKWLLHAVCGLVLPECCSQDSLSDTHH